MDGETLLHGNLFVELQQALVLQPKELEVLVDKVTDALRLYAFVDSGGVWADAGDLDFGDFRYSAGLGLGFNVPMLGPIRVDYGYPLNPDNDQSSSGRLHLATGFRF